MYSDTDAEACQQPGQPMVGRVSHFEASSMHTKAGRRRREPRSGDLIVFDIIAVYRCLHEHARYEVGGSRRTVARLLASHLPPCTS